MYSPRQCPAWELIWRVTLKSSKLLPTTWWSLGWQKSGARRDVTLRRRRHAKKWELAFWNSARTILGATSVSVIRMLVLVWRMYERMAHSLQASQPSLKLREMLCRVCTLMTLYWLCSSHIANSRNYQFYPCHWLIFISLLPGLV